MIMFLNCKVCFQNSSLKCDFLELIHPWKTKLFITVISLESKVSSLQSKESLLQSYVGDTIQFLICRPKLPCIRQVGKAEKDLLIWVSAEGFSYKAQVWASASLWGEGEKGMKHLAMAVCLLLAFLFSFSTSLQVPGKSLFSAEHEGLQMCFLMLSSHPSSRRESAV